MPIINRRQFIHTLLSSSALVSLPALSGWQVKPSLPYSVQEIYPAMHDGKIYVAGGLSPDAKATQGITRRLAIYDPATEKWTDGPSMPEPRHHPFLLSHQQKLYAFSGFVGSELGRWSASADVLVLDETSQRWRKLSGSMPFPLCETVGSSFATNIHLASGRRPKGMANVQWRDHADVDSHLIFDPVGQSWRRGIPIPTARNSAASATVGEQWYVIGGRTVDGGNVAVNEVYDHRQERWEKRAAMPQAQGGLAAAALRDKIYLFGGEYFDNGGGVYKTVWEYSTQEDKWRKVSEMPMPRHGLGAVSWNDSIYVIAGATQAGGRGTSDRMVVFKL